MSRVTQKQLESLVDRLNEVTNSPRSYFNEETRKINIGHYCLDYAYGGVALEKTVNEGGAVCVIIGRGTKRELYDRLHALLDGIRIAKEV